MRIVDEEKLNHRFLYPDVAQRMTAHNHKDNKDAILTSRRGPPKRRRKEEIRDNMWQKKRHCVQQRTGSTKGFFVVAKIGVPFHVQFFLVH